MCERIPHLIVKHVDHHQRQKTEDESQENDQHHDGQPQIVLISEEFQLAFCTWGCVELVQLCMLLPNGVENAGIRENDDETGQQEANQEDEVLW